MSRQRFIVLLAAALLAISGALFLSSQRNLARDTHGMPLLPSLANELNTVSELSLRKGSATAAVTIHKQGEQWIVPERANYPADVPKLRKLLLALSDAKIREEKTSNPASYSVIGVEDPSLPGAAGTQIDVTAQDGKHAVIVGKSVGEGSFVRRAGEKISYIVEPGISFETEPRFWIEPKLLDLPADKIQRIEVKPAGGPSYIVHRVAAPGDNNKSTASASASASASAGAGAPAAGPFALDGVPSGRKAADSPLLAPSPTAFSGLTADDVAAARDLDFSNPSIATLTLSDGNIVAFTGTTIGDKRWIQVTHPTDAALTARTAGRAFEIPSYRYDAIFRPLEQLLVPKEQKAPATNKKVTVPKKSAVPPAS
ncbi:MAG TPA: DUF4340 domain-containing protein [Steroidobacteraceae bacterium]|nr:DUF4340 domain-containing protein [Steroidobacteraceae bacterium]